MLTTVLVVVAIAVLYWLPIRRWMNQWGTTPADLARIMVGDNLLPNFTYSGTTAVIVNAPPQHIWPWLVQIGNERGGLYSYDWLDRLFGFLNHPSATRILPEFQHLAVGDHIPLGRGPSWPVGLVEHDRALVLDMRSTGGMDWVWQFGLYPVDEKRTQLVSRSRVRAPTIWTKLLTSAIEPAGFLMTRRMLMGLKRRAEALEASPLVGDDLLPRACAQATHHVDIQAPPSQVWPWLVQMGCQRGGWYSWDVLDNGGRRSAERIVPDLQTLAIGDILPLSRRGKEGVAVLVLEPPRALVLGSPSILSGKPSDGKKEPRATWAFCLEPVGTAASRLVVRVRAEYAPTLIADFVVNPAVRALHNVMERKQLRTLKQRAEAA